ncbi:hypothetical protein FFRU_020960 [Fructobacillus fructosus]|uniref:MrcB family domain-containing protein n=1 Tax=Fructobacillus fructosus TaxID=1631 RepID=UPI0002195D4C|nr:DUF3578 domain-containing protein [Fructobacillus fructosus]KRN53127.1 hypothetical protein IV71_GL000686 [Fructobacillus fructosus KCTC 3544]GAP00905.1 hypothetical protein FFRU_020960 [Fructobacillus fructosus]
MNIHDTLETVFNNYLAEKEKPFKANWLAATLRQGFDADELFFNADNVKIYGSGGTGLWAAAPWIAICDTDITKSVQRGFFVVYLFSEDMKRVYLSLNQGWTFWEKEFKNETIDMPAEEKARTVASYFQNELSIRNTALPMKLSSDNSKHNSLAFGYEAGEIYSIEYDANQLPTNTELVKDIELMWSKLMSVKAMMQDTKDLEKSATYILNYQCTTTYTDNAAEAEAITDKLEHASLIEKERPTLRKKLKPTKNKKRTVRRIDYLAEQERNQKLGLSGEELVLEYEKERLVNYPELQDKVKRVSKEGDGDGYDIFSFNFDGSPLYIEVKTTNHEATTPFFMSQNEYAFALENKEDYVIYRLYRFTDLAKKNIDQVKFYKIQGQNIEHELNLTPAAYQVNLK